MGNDSRSGGYLAPAAALAPDGDGLDDALQALVVGITGLDPALVRPRWQPEEPQQPGRSTDWAAVGVSSQAPDANPWDGHDPAGGGGLGVNNTQRHETIEVLCSFYGPNAQALGGILRDGLFVAQNRETARAQGLGLVEVSPLVRAPELVGTLWLERVDVTVTFRRQVDRTYPVRTLLSVAGGIGLAGPVPAGAPVSAAPQPLPEPPP